MAEQATVPDSATLAARAQEATGLSDFGDPWIFENLEALIPALDGEARLTPAGAAGAAAMIERALVNRLRHVDLVKRHPEILDETVEVAAVVVGLPRTGSTMLHRMLAAAPGMTGMKWFETQNYAPFPGEARGESGRRREWAEGLMSAMLQAIPELMSIHPMSIDQPDEELIAMGLLFSSTMIEGTYYVPSYARWLVEHSRTRCYPDLKQILQSMQWQDPSRRGAKWVLKTPGHLMAIDAVAETFPDALIVMTHRDPLSTVPSYASMMQTLYRMSAEADPVAIGAFWEKRLAELLGMFMRAREALGDDRFCDVRYTDLLREPIEQGRRVLARAGVEVTPAVIEGMAEWIEANRREDRAPHRYTLEDFALDRDEIERDFAAYRARFLAEQVAA